MYIYIYICVCVCGIYNSACRWLERPVTAGPAESVVCSDRYGQLIATLSGMTTMVMVMTAGMMIMTMKRLLMMMMKNDDSDGFACGMYVHCYDHDCRHGQDGEE